MAKAGTRALAVTVAATLLTALLYVQRSLIPADYLCPTPPSTPTPQVSASGRELRRSLGLALSRLAAGRARLIFYHVHKSGGSSMCYALVKANSSLMGCTPEFQGQVVAHRSNAWCNCNGEVVPTPIATGPPAAVEQYLQRHQPVAFFNEDGVASDPYFGPAAAHIIVVRHPIHRYLSHMLHVLTMEDNLNMSSIDVSQAALQHSSRPPGEQGGILDNYLTRYAAGWSVLGSPSKAGVWGVHDAPVLTYQHFATALRNLERMQVVLVLEEVDAAAPLLQALGLPPYASDTRAGTSFSAAGMYQQLSSDAMRHLERQHEWDFMLYSWSQQRHRRLLEAHQQLAGLEGGQDRAARDTRP